MLKLKDVLGHYEFYTGKASDLGRTLSLSGIALIWLLLAGQQSSNLDLALWRVLLLFSAVLILDFAQYQWLAFWWSRFLAVYESPPTNAILRRAAARLLARTRLPDVGKEGKLEDDVDPHPWFIYVGSALHLTKVAMLAFAWIQLWNEIYLRKTPNGLWG